PCTGREAIVRGIALQLKISFSQFIKNSVSALSHVYLLRYCNIERLCDYVNKKRVCLHRFISERSGGNCREAGGFCSKGGCDLAGRRSGGGKNRICAGFLAPSCE